MSEGRKNPISLEKNNYLFLQGEKSDAFYILLKGSLEVLINDPGDFPLNPELVNRKGKRVAVIDDKTPVGELGCLRNEPRSASIRAAEDCKLTRIEANFDNIDNIIKENVHTGFFLIKTLLKRFIESNYTLDQMEDMLKTLQRLIDNTSIIMHSYTSQLYKDRGNFDQKYLSVIKELVKHPVIKRGTKLKAQLTKSNIHIPEKFTFAFLENDYSKLFNRKYGVKHKIPKNTIEPSMVRIFDKLINEQGSSFQDIFLNDTDLIIYLSKTLANSFTVIDENLLKCTHIIERLFDLFTNDRMSILKVCYILWLLFNQYEEKNKRTFANILKRIIDVSEHLHNEYIEYLGKDFPNYFSKIDTFKSSIDSFMELAVKKTKVTVGNKDIDPLSINPLAKIENSNFISTENKQNLIKYLNEFKNLENKVDDDLEIRKLRRNLKNAYWKVYSLVFNHVLNENDNSPEWQYMLRYGFLDPSLLPEEKILELPVPQSDKTDDIPVYYGDEWISSIYNGDNSPSNNELGQSFQETMKEDGAADMTGPSEEQLSSYEIEQMLKPAVRTCAGSTLNDFPILCDEFLRGSIKNCLITKKQVVDIIQDILSVDYSLFFREIRTIVGKNAEFFMQEIFPNFILVPGGGTKAVCWMEIEGKDKKSRARIVVPTFCLDDLRDMMLFVLGNFRWILCKTMMGYNWANPTEGGLTGKYFDYASFWKKNTDLSEEQKEHIKNYFSKYRTNGERIAFDYTQWIKFEKDGITKLNKVVRGIFFQYIPFPKAIRDDLVKKPMYERFVNLDRNRKIKNIKLLQKKLQKYSEIEPNIEEIMATTFRYYQT